MTDYAPGMRAVIRDEEWLIKRIETNSLGHQVLHCVGVTPLVKDRDAIFLTDLEQIQIVDPASIQLIADSSPFFKRSLLYLESQWRQQLPTDTNLHIGHKAAMDPMPYQLDPAKLSLQRPRQRILIADTVGLGKTLEAGILMSELIARGKGKRILVVTVKSMMTQFQKEMWNRFTLPLVRLDSNRIQKIRASLPSNYNPFFYYDKTIVSIDTLKRDVEYRTHLEKAYWDIIVIDEAQNVAERGDHQAQRSRLAKLLANRSDTMIMLSATPHDGRAKSFASLMNMLDPTAIADPENYTPEDIRGLCIRRFKSDVKNQVNGSFLERQVTLEHCHASAQEEYAFDLLAEMQLEMDAGKAKSSGRLFKTSLEKSLFSSPAACRKSIEARLKKLYKKYTADDISDIRLLEELHTALGQVTPENFMRYQKLLELLRSDSYGWNPKDPGDRVVIFTERIETMNYLAEHLRTDLGLKSSAIQEISGGMSDAEQQRIVEDFGRTESPIRILVASDVASEGLNLHYLSHRLIHFDIPWSLMVFQQRNGRIDRYGQQKRPDIRYLLIESNILKINYRTTEEIRHSAFSFLEGLSFDDLDESTDSGTQCQSLTHGEPPIIRNFPDANAEFNFIYTEIRKLQNSGILLKEICIVARTKNLTNDYLSLLTKASIRSYAIKRNQPDNRNFDGIRVATMHRVKGLEFKYVFIAALNHRVVPLAAAINHMDPISEKESITSEKCLLYVAMTRAQKGVYITSYGTCSQFLHQSD